MYLETGSVMDLEASRAAAAEYPETHAQFLFDMVMLFVLTLCRCRG